MSPWQLFYSYSHKDSDLRERLATYLAPLKQQNKIEEWYDRRIEPGQNWEKEITDDPGLLDDYLIRLSRPG